VCVCVCVCVCVYVRERERERARAARMLAASSSRLQYYRRIISFPQPQIRCIAL